MNNSFEQLFKKINPYKELPSKNQHGHLNYFKKQPKPNPSCKKKNPLNTSHSKYPPDPFQYSIMTNGSLQKNLNKANTSKSNHKRSTKREDTTQKKNKQDSLMRKCPTLQLTKKQKQIREAIEYRFEKSKMRTYKYCCRSLRFDENEDQKARQIIDDEEEERFASIYGYLVHLKIVNLYEYSQFQQQVIASQNQKESQKLIVIKNPKKKRQNSETMISFDNSKNDESKWPKNNNTKLILNSNSSNYISNNPIKSQRNHTQVATNCHQLKKSESPAHHFKLQFPSSKAFNKPKTGSRPKFKTENSVGLGQKILNSSSVQKNFKSIKDIYLNAISNLANKSTVKSNNKLFKNQNDSKNRGSKNALYDSEKKGSKNQYHSTKPNKIIQSSSALQQNYFSCISSRQNKKEDKSYNRKGTQERLDKTLLINQANSLQWKSVIMKVDQGFKPQTKQAHDDGTHQKKKFKFKLKIKDNAFQKCNKSGFSGANGKFIGHSHSYRENTKSPKFKRFVINEDDDKECITKMQNPKYMSSIKNLSSQTYQKLLNDSQVSMKEQFLQNKRTKK